VARTELGDEDDALDDGVVDEVARRVWRTGGSVLAVRREDVPATALRPPSSATRRDPDPRAGRRGARLRC
jgi:hypothetical protein